MIKKIKVIFQIFCVVLVIAAVVGLFIHFWFFYKAENGSQKFVASLTGDFSPLKKTFYVEEGIVVFNILPRNCFLLKYEKGQGGATFPWEDVVFVTTTFNGVEKKLSSEKCWRLIPRDGELTMAVSFNAKYFDPKQVKIFTGVKDNSPTGFVGGYLLVNFRHFKSGEEIGKIPEVVDIPKPEKLAAAPDFESEKATAEKGGKSFFDFLELPDLSGDDEEEGFFDPIFPEKQQEIKRRWDASNAEARRLWNNFFSSEKGEEGEKK